MINTNHLIAIANQLGIPADTRITVKILPVNPRSLLGFAKTEFNYDLGIIIHLPLTHTDGFTTTTRTDAQLARTFAHELGHIYHYQQVPGAYQLPFNVQENEADRFAALVLQAA